MATFAPITIKEAYNGGNRFPRIVKDTVVSVIARVTEVKVMNKYKILFELSDLTGKISTVCWLDEYVISTPNIKVNDYVQVYGTIRETKEHNETDNRTKKELIAFKIVSITDIDAITCHYLQCIHKKYLDPYFCEKVIFNHIKKFDADGGIPKVNLCDDSQIQKMMTRLDIENAIDRLWEKGYIYSTIDEDHYKDTTAFEEF